MHLRLVFCLVLAMGAAVFPSLASAQGSGQKIALVIGNANYPDADRPVAVAVKDARLIAEELTRNGFEVDRKENVSKEAMKSADKPEGVDMDFDHMDVDLKLECEGELVWNLAASRVESLELSGPVNMNMDMAMKLAMGDRTMNLEQAFEMSGTFTSSVKAK